MANGHNSLDIFTKIEWVKEFIFSKVGKLNDREIQLVLCHCWYYKMNRRKKLNDLEHTVLDLFLQNNLSPKTVYTWFLVNNAPEHIKLKVKNRKIGLVKAISESYHWRNMMSRRGSDKLMEDIKNVMRGLVWKSQEN